MEQIPSTRDALARRHSSAELRPLWSEKSTSSERERATNVNVVRALDDHAKVVAGAILHSDRYSALVAITTHYVKMDKQ